MTAMLYRRCFAAKNLNVICEKLRHATSEGATQRNLNPFGKYKMHAYLSYLSSAMELGAMTDTTAVDLSAMTAKIH